MDSTIFRPATFIEIAIDNLTNALKTQGFTDLQPVVAEMLPGGQGYRVRFLPPWADYPSGVEDGGYTDTLRINQWIEGALQECPEQYLWAHRRFKSRPPGAPKLY